MNILQVALPLSDKTKRNDPLARKFREWPVMSVSMGSGSGLIVRDNDAGISFRAGPLPAAAGSESPAGSLRAPLNELK